MPQQPAIEFAPRCLGTLRYWFQPAPEPGTRSVLVAVHGVRRQALDQFAAFSAWAGRRRCHLLVPLFDPIHYPDYQRLGRPGHGHRADLHLIALLGDLAQRFDFDADDLLLFGHSGGAQFVHRFVMAYPDMVRRYALSAAGWYTFPDETADFPMGTSHLPAGFPAFVARRFLRVRGRVFVGQREHPQSPLLRRNESLDAVQGCDRLDRARRWVEAMRIAARAHALPGPLSLEELPGAAHSFRGLVRRAGLADRVGAFLLPSDRVPSLQGAMPESHDAASATPIRR